MTTADIVEVADAGGEAIWHLRLYVAGQSPKSLRGLGQPDEAVRGAPRRALRDRGRSTWSSTPSLPGATTSSPFPRWFAVSRAASQDHRRPLQRRERADRSATGSRMSASEPSADDVGVEEEFFYELTLFVSGASDLSARAIANARRLCETHLRRSVPPLGGRRPRRPGSAADQRPVGDADAGQEPAAARAAGWSATCRTPKGGRDAGPPSGARSPRLVS